MSRATKKSSAEVKCEPLEGVVDALTYDVHFHEYARVVYTPYFFPNIHSTIPPPSF